MNILLLIVFVCAAGTHTVFSKTFELVPEYEFNKTMQFMKTAVDSNDIATLRLLIDYPYRAMDKVMKGEARRLLGSTVQSFFIPPIINRFLANLTDSTSKKYEIEFNVNPESPSLWTINLHPTKNSSTSRI